MNGVEIYLFIPRQLVYIREGLENWLPVYTITAPSHILYIYRLYGQGKRREGANTTYRGNGLFFSMESFSDYRIKHNLFLILPINSLYRMFFLA